MIELNAEYLAAGANRHPSAADWDVSGILAFGTDRNIALWRPQVRHVQLQSESPSIQTVAAK
jgi:hypothetical protein